MTFEPTGDMCALLLVGVAHAFGKVGHVQRSVRKTANRTLKELEGSERGLNTSPNARIWSFLDTPFFASLATALSYSSILPRTSRGSGYILALCLCTSVS